MRRTLADRIFLDKTIKRISNKFKKLGLYSEANVSNFLIQRLLLSICLFIIILIFSKYGYILAPTLTIIFYFFWEYLNLDYKIKVRCKKLEKEALFYFEVLALTLEGGRSLKHALEVTSNNIDSEISLEFKNTIRETKMGKGLNEALEDMKKRIPSDAINNVILNMIEANTYGTSIINSVNNEIDYLREKQILDIKAIIAKLPTKISVISVIFFIPIMLLIILAPVIINYLLS